MNVSLITQYMYVYLVALVKVQVVEVSAVVARIWPRNYLSRLPLGSGRKPPATNSTDQLISLYHGQLLSLLVCIPPESDKVWQLNCKQGGLIWDPPARCRVPLAECAVPCFTIFCSVPAQLKRRTEKFTTSQLSSLV